MATRADFTEDEWRALHKGVTGAGMLVSVSDQDFTDSFGEASALGKFLAHAHQNADNPLIREIAGTHGTGFGLFSSPQAVEKETMESLRAATATLSAKAPDDLEPYRQLVLDTAEAVAEAKGGGVSDKETAAIETIQAALA
jgi:hypothetical protein